MNTTLVIRGAAGHDTELAIGEHDLADNLGSRQIAIKALAPGRAE